MIRASAPGRAGIIGNPSDIYGGTVVSVAVPLRATCILEPSDEWSLPDDLRLWRAATARYPLDRPYRVVWDTQIPVSRGISGSTALLAATLLCVLEARGDAPELDTVQKRTAFAELVRDIERHEADVVCGYQDAQMIVHGGLQAMDFRGKHPVEPGPPPTVIALHDDLPFLVVSTDVERLSGSVHGPMAQRWVDGEAAVVEGIARISELGRLGLAALESRDWMTLGALMQENQRVTASLGGSGEPIDRLVDACLRHGALGAKLAGAGLGGTVIALTLDPDRLESELRAEGYTLFTRPDGGPGVRLEP